MTLRRLLLLALLASPFAACASADPATSAAPGRSAGDDGAVESDESVESVEGDATGPDRLPHVGGQTGGEAGIRCSADTALDPIELDTVTAIGYSPADIIAGLPTRHDVELDYAEGQMSALHITLAYDGPVAFAAGCNRIELDVSVQLSTQDGAFAETLHGRLFASSPDAASLSSQVSIDALAGNYASQHAAALPEGATTLSFSFEIGADGVFGSIDAISGADDSASSQPIASF